ncbi:LppX_LprAFG lipoprotein [Amycolatopsis acidiphila]|uniref:LppX_LprAFG lipoprotein n=1 Tax=Amycolatopsis acidiphila TaxID=715473 RepID=A0A557ZPR1_9PSEU|nr:LppX_LprAFG lipoprotein [Amycolatopsis acidiphila]TVT14015.1 LppX_LprAFG lipoprotein [Amycolatopsis acidiphila]UIJ61060.1 LppX_LprAFG lipoprotein [Amycolatopsis acidiphila]GHG99277.1 lipoprotein [Amycolatopsis acidiphila]
MLRRRTAGVLLLILALASGCATSPDTRGPVPDGAELVTAAAATLGKISSVQFDFSISGIIPGLDVREVKGWASRAGGPAGSAIGQADMQESTNRFELKYEITGNQLVLTDQHGTRTQEPVPAEYSPAALLAEGRGLPKLLTSATGLKTETKEDVKGVETYRVTGELGKDAIASVVPQIQADVDVKFWVTQTEPRTLVRVWMQVPPRQPNEGAVMLELGLSGVNTPPSSAPGS